MLRTITNLAWRPLSRTLVGYMRQRVQRERIHRERIERELRDECAAHGVALAELRNLRGCVQTQRERIAELEQTEREPCGAPWEPYLCGSHHRLWETDTDYCIACVESGEATGAKANRKQVGATISPASEADAETIRGLTATLNPGSPWRLALKRATILPAGQYQRLLDAAEVLRDTFRGDDAPWGAPTAACKVVDEAGADGRTTGELES